MRRRSSMVVFYTARMVLEKLNLKPGGAHDGRTSPRPSSACSGTWMGNLRALRNGNMGSGGTITPSVLCEDSQKLRSFQGQPRVAERAGGVSISTSASPRAKRTALWCRLTPYYNCEVLSNSPSVARNMPNSGPGTCYHRDFSCSCAPAN